MYYYKHHIGDFRSGTSNMSRQERWLYRDMLDVYYDKESPLPIDLQDVCDSIGATDEESKSVAKILRLKFNLGETGWVHERCEVELDTYRANAEKARDNGKKGGRPRKNNPAGSLPVAIGMQDGTGWQPDCNPQESGSQANHKPLTTNQDIKALVPSMAEDAPRPGKPECPHQEIIKIYHEVLPQCPAVRDWTPARATQLRARWNESPDRQELGYWRGLFEYVGKCDFLVGRTSKPFFADLEFITKSNNFTKIREGKYENR